jgi:hypothetical protein
VIRGEGTAVARGVTPQEAFDFVLDPAQYTKADTKMVWVTKLGDTADGMIAREDGRFLGRFPGSVITRYRWEAPHRIDVTLEHGLPRHLHAWFEIDEVEGGTRIHHVEEMDFGRGPLGWVYDQVGGQWFADSVRQEVAEIARLLEGASAARAWPHTTTTTRVSRGNRGRARPAPDASRLSSPARGRPCRPACTGTCVRGHPTRNRAPSHPGRVGRAWRLLSLLPLGECLADPAAGGEIGRPGQAGGGAEPTKAPHAGNGDRPVPGNPARERADDRLRHGLRR